MCTRLDRVRGAIDVFGSVNDVDVAALEEAHKVRCMLLPDDRQLHRAFGIIQSAIQ